MSETSNAYTSMYENIINQITNDLWAFDFAPSRVAKFETVSSQQYYECVDKLIEKEIDLSYAMDMDEIDLPSRGTEQSAGYDFVSPISFKLAPGEQIIIPTGIRCKMYSNQVLMLYPRSSVGIKHNISFANTTPIIDADYYNAKNEGHILLAFKNSNKRYLFNHKKNKAGTWVVNAGDRICQGIILQYGITTDDNANAKREGGIGSTGS